MKTLLFIIISLLFLAQNNVICNDTLNQEIENQSSIPKNYLGVAVSSISSIGISYHKLMGASNKPTSALKITFIILPDLYDDEIWIFLGGELQSNFYMNDFSRVYALVGAAYQSLDISIGLGMGYELFSGSPGIAVNIDGGIALWNSIKNTHGTSLGGGSEIVPGLGLGLSYAF